jgi:type VI secretion system protein ImpA
MSGSLFDIETLLAPLDGADGAGIDLRSDYSPTSPYQKLRDARAEARAEERALETSEESDPSVPQGWREVKRIALQCIGERSKDFEVAAWLLEALVRLDGLAGLIAGAQLATGLLERYWEPGFPQPDEDGMDIRAAPLGGLSGEGADGTLMQPLRRMALFRRPDGRAVGLHLWKIAEDTEAIPNEGDNKKRRKARYDAGVPEMKALENEARVEAAALRRTAQQALQAQRAWATLAAQMDARFGDLAPNTRRVSEALEQIIQIASRLIGPVAEAAPEAGGEIEPVEEVAAMVEEAPAGAGAAVAVRPLRTREDAIRQLEDLAEYFRRTEPHSPLAYTLTDAVRRARMPLPDLLAEVLPDNGARQAMLTMLGIRSAMDEGS